MDVAANRLQLMVTLEITARAHSRRFMCSVPAHVGLEMVCMNLRRRHMEVHVEHMEVYVEHMCTLSIYTDP